MSSPPPPHGTCIRWQLRTYYARANENFEYHLNYVTSVEPNKCLKQIKIPSSLYSGATISELPSNKKYQSLLYSTRQ